MLLVGSFFLVMTSKASAPRASDTVCSLLAWMPQSSLSFPIISNSPTSRVIPISQQLPWLPDLFYTLINLAGLRATFLTTRWNSFPLLFIFQARCLHLWVAMMDGLVFTLIYSNMHKESTRIPIPLINVPIRPKSLHFLLLIMFRFTHDVVVATLYLGWYFFPWTSSDPLWSFILWAGCLENHPSP